MLYSVEQSEQGNCLDNISVTAKQGAAQRWYTYDIAKGLGNASNKEGHRVICETVRHDQSAGGHTIRDRHWRTYMPLRQVLIADLKNLACARISHSRLTGKCISRERDTRLPGMSL